MLQRAFDVPKIPDDLFARLGVGVSMAIKGIEAPSRSRVIL